jgi:hypothetical protein
MGGGGGDLGVGEGEEGEGGGGGGLRIYLVLWNQHHLLSYTYGLGRVGTASGSENTTRQNRTEVNQRTRRSTKDQVGFNSSYLK